MEDASEHGREVPVREDWFSRLKDPRTQAVLAAGVMVVFVGLGLLSSLAGSGPPERWGYQSAATALMIFGVGNALMSLAAENVARYWSVSFVAFALLAALGLLLAWGSSGIWIAEAGSYRFIFLVLTFGYLVLLSITSMMRGIVNFAEREEWSQPRRRD